MSPSATLPTSLTRILNDTEGHMRGVRILATTLADYMQKLHGGEWKIAIDHKHRFVMIVPHPGKRGGVECD